MESMTLCAWRRPRRILDDLSDIMGQKTLKPAAYSTRERLRSCFCLPWYLLELLLVPQTPKTSH
jgi:hypothetical protein